MKLLNILLFVFITIISYSQAASSTSSGSTTSMPSLQSDTSSSSSSSQKSSSKASSSSQSSSKSSSKSSSSTSKMPTISTTTSASVSNGTYTSNSTTSSYSVTFTPIVPTGLNPDIQIETLPKGTTFIAVGGVLGLLFSVLFLTRLIMSCISSKNAKKGIFGNQEEQEHPRFDYDPSLFHRSELKKNYTRTSIYSLGSGSTLNVLGSQATMEQMVAPSGRSLRSALMNNKSRASLFISPTEMLANQQIYGGFDSPESIYFSQNSPIESPATAAYANSTPAPSVFDRSTNDINRGFENKRPSRPPSVFMEQLFDDEEEFIPNGSQYDEHAANRV